MKKTKRQIEVVDVLCGAGIVLCAAGVYLIQPAYCLIFLGCCLILLAVLGAIQSGAKAK